MGGRGKVTANGKEQIRDERLPGQTVSEGAGSYRVGHAGSYWVSGCQDRMPLAGYRAHSQRNSAPCRTRVREEVAGSGKQWAGSGMAWGSGKGVAGNSREWQRWQ